MNKPSHNTAHSTTQHNSTQHNTHNTQHTNSPEYSTNLAPHSALSLLTALRLPVPVGPTNSAGLDSLTAKAGEDGGGGGVGVSWVG